ncbi:hypothetical protein MMC21_003858 [Puttea exsequens]|nr:hypothetical protein [Puttea exsequens]
MGSYETVPNTLSSFEHGSEEAIAASMSPFADEHYTDFYDAHILKFMKPGPGSDIELIWDTLHKLLLKSRSSSLNVVDMGVGTGRVLRGLLEIAHSQGIEKLDVKFFGVDPGRAMLERGKELVRSDERLRSIADVEWVSSDALGFTADQPALYAATDLLYFAGGGFNHLLSPTEILGFLRELARALRTGSPNALAIIVIQSESMPSRMASIPNYDGERSVTRSETMPDINYEKSADSKTWAGPYHVDAFELKVKSTKDGSVLKKFNFRFDLALFDEEAWPELVEKAGMRIAREKDYALGRAYYLQNKLK